MLRAIVFDFDGVIANSEPLHFQAFRDVLAKHRVDLTETDYYARYLGFDDVGVFTAVDVDLGQGWSERDRADMVADKALRLAELEHDVPILFPGAADAIRRAAASVPLAIASGALGPEIRRTLDREQLTQHFAVIVSAEDTPLGKPAPDPYQLAVVLLRTHIGGVPLQPSDCVAIEDSRWGLESARLAGLRTVGVTTAYSRDELAPYSDLIIGSVAALNLQDLHDLLSS
jgi:beta-phosphoglucomutase-like phosphatase (HAD superfamily)